MRGARITGIVLIIWGFLYLLQQLVPGLHEFWTTGVMWGAVLLLVGLYGSARKSRRHVSWWGIFCIALGVLFVLKYSGLVPAFGHVTAWAMCWAVLLVVLGVALLVPRKPKIMVSVNGRVHEVDVTALKDSWREWKCRSDRRWIGDISIGGQPWKLKDTDLWHAVGDVRVNLATAHIDDGTYHLNIGGWVGDVRVLVPESLPVRVEAHVGIGDVNVFDDYQSGTGRHVQCEDPRFKEAAKRVIIRIDLKIGEVQVLRV